MTIELGNVRFDVTEAEITGEINRLVAIRTAREKECQEIQENISKLMRVRNALFGERA